MHPGGCGVDGRAEEETSRHSEAMAATRASGRLSEADRLRKGILELMDTEGSYIQDLIDLRDHYLEPLKLEEFFTHLELDSVLSVLHEIILFHQEFVATLRQGMDLAPDFQNLQSPADFKRVLFSLGGSFLFFSERFRLYSAYCASHARTQSRLRTASEEPALAAALRRLNPDGQHASSLPSLLIKPIQRVLKYPLLLHSLVSPTEPDSEERYHMAEAQRVMQEVAGQINDAQRLFEEFGEAFHQLSAQQQPSGDEVVDLSMGDLLLDEHVSWLNPPAPLIRSAQRQHGLGARVFVFKTAVVLVYKEDAAMGSLRAKKRDEPDLIKYKHLIPTSQLEVHTEHSADGGRSAVWELRHAARGERPAVTFTLLGRDPSRRSACVSAVRSLLRAALRSRLLNRDASTTSSSATPPPSSSSRHYQPFGGDRLSALRARYHRQDSSEPSSRRLRKNSSSGGISSSIDSIDSISSSIDSISSNDNSLSHPPEPTPPARPTETSADFRDVKRRLGASRRQQAPLAAGAAGAAGGLESDHRRPGDGGEYGQMAGSYGGHRDNYKGGIGVIGEERYDAGGGGATEGDHGVCHGRGDGGGDDQIVVGGGIGNEGAPRGDYEREGRGSVRKGHRGLGRESEGGIDVPGDLRVGGDGGGDMGRGCGVGYGGVGGIEVCSREGGRAVEGHGGARGRGGASLDRGGVGRGTVGGGSIDGAAAAGRRDNPAGATGVGGGLRRADALDDRRARTLDGGRSRRHRDDDRGDHPQPPDAALAEATLLLRRLQARNLERQRRRAASRSSGASSPRASPLHSPLPSPPPAVSRGGGPVTPQQALERSGHGARAVYDTRTQAIAFGERLA
uniref:T-lymphoma invasion and metastasis-inducing protein 1-like isoform X1 n=3 Tax=Petromyzon marinus TaxID=7757 RepID=A0AAJ7XFQ3_PETMA|nr:T-lymphoma invasion and metastasis-inducing protein 1-like isoform X1 [Petromyzon marinus]